MSASAATAAARTSELSLAVAFRTASLAAVSPRRASAPMSSTWASGGRLGISAASCLVMPSPLSSGMLAMAAARIFGSLLRIVLRTSGMASAPAVRISPSSAPRWNRSGASADRTSL